MTSKSVSSKSVSKEPLLNTLARKLGHAAGALTQVANEFTGKIAPPEEAAASPKLKPARRRAGLKSKSRKRSQTVGARGKKEQATGLRKPAAPKKRASRPRPQKKNKN
jgi:hypothetical protein